jgi:hypothetical protein
MIQTELHKKNKEIIFLRFEKNEMYVILQNR